MTWQLRSSNAVSVTSATPTITNLGTSAKDVIFLKITMPLALTPTTPAGFTILFAFAGSGGTGSITYYRIANGSEGNFSISIGSSTTTTIAYSALYNDNGETPALDAAGVGTTAAGASHTSPSVSAAATGELAYSDYAILGTTANTWTEPSGYAEIVDYHVAGARSTGMAWKATSASGGQTVTATATHTGTAGRIGLAFFTSSAGTVISGAVMTSSASMLAGSQSLATPGAVMTASALMPAGASALTTFGAVMLSTARMLAGIARAVVTYRGQPPPGTSSYHAKRPQPGTSTRGNGPPPGR